MEIVPLMIRALASLTVVGQVIAVLLLVFLLLRRNIPQWFPRAAWPSAFAVAAVSMFGSLFFSEVADFTPCELCWYQRILMYPMAILLAVALIRAEKVLAPYLLTLSLAGMAVAAYHYAIQLGVTTLAPCTAKAFGVSCATKQTLTFGYITIPVMAFTAFALIAEAMIVVLLEKRRNRKIE